MDRDTFLKNDSWFGSYYELCLELGPTGDDGRLSSALNYIWAQPQLYGAWPNRNDFGISPSPPVEIVDGSIPARYGTISLADDVCIGCISHTVRETDGSDWLDLCIPTGMLELVYDVHYPLDYATNSWMPAIDRLLTTIGSSVFEVHPFRLGIIGEEVSGTCYADSISGAGCPRNLFLLPEPLWRTLSVDREPTVLPSGLMAVDLRED